MTGVVVDASVLVACALSDGKTRRAFFSSYRRDYFAPEFIREELLSRVPKILALSKVAPIDLSVLLDDLFGRMTIVPREGYLRQLPLARKVAERADADGDEDYVALALTLDAPVWTYDKDFLRIREIRVITTGQIIDEYLE